MKKTIRIIIITLLVLLSVGLIVYPYIANYVFERSAGSVVETVQKTTDKIDNAKQEEMLALAEEYNNIIASGHVKLTDPFVEDKTGKHNKEYESLLRVSDDGVMGSIEIPSLKVLLPIYHGTSDEVLKSGAGHLQGTSLPVGGLSTHSAITGHTGLSNAKLFTDLEELVKGDYFFINTINGRLAYKVDEISVVTPEEMTGLGVVKDKDYCTLITCTPYGKNTHRLLVRGERVAYEEVVEHSLKPKNIGSKWMKEYKQALFISFGLLGISLCVLFAIRLYRRRDDFI